MSIWPGSETLSLEMVSHIRVPGLDSRLLTPDSSLVRMWTLGSSMDGSIGGILAFFLEGMDSASGFQVLPDPTSVVVDIGGVNLQIGFLSWCLFLFVYTHF